MILASFDDYVWYNTPVRNGWTQAWLQAKIEDRNLSLQKFPYFITLAGGWHEFDELESWLVPYLGQADGPCDQCTSEFPSCPDYLYLRILMHPGSYFEEDYIPYWAFKTGAWVPQELSKNVYYKRTWHEHIGVWKTANPIKTGYDYGLCDFLFKYEKDFDLFKSILPVYLSKHKERSGEQ